MSNRQSGNIALIVMAVLVVFGVVGAGLFVISRRSNDEQQNEISKESDSTNSITPKLEDKPDDTEEKIIDVDLLLQRSGDESNLPSETPETFVDLMETKLNDFDCDFTENPNAGYTFSKISPRFISGGVGCLGGAGVIWYLTTAGWEELGYQSMVPCSKLIELAIPLEFMAECYDDTSPGEEIIENPNGSLNSN